MCAHSIQTVVESSREPLTVLQSDPQATMLLLRLPPTASLPERRHLRSDVVLQLVAGAVEIDGFVARSLQAPEVLFIPRGRPYSLGNVSTEERVVLFVITPGVTTLESRPFGSVRCPLCSAEIAVEEGDQPGDRFICPDCTAKMRLVEADRGYAAGPAE